MTSPKFHSKLEAEAGLGPQFPVPSSKTLSPTRPPHAESPSPTRPTWQVLQGVAVDPGLGSGGRVWPPAHGSGQALGTWSWGQQRCPSGWHGEKGVGTRLGPAGLCGFFPHQLPWTDALKKERAHSPGSEASAIHSASQDWAGDSSQSPRIHRIPPHGLHESLEPPVVR